MRSHGNLSVWGGHSCPLACTLERADAGKNARSTQNHVIGMSTVATVSSDLRDLYARESAAIQQEFSVTGEGRAALARRTALVDSILLRLWSEIISADPQGPKNFALVATGGFGRGWLFPHSDIDLLFLHAGADTESALKDPIRLFSQELWDLRLKLSPATRTLAECERFDPNNVEFAISLLDCRYLAGDRDLFTRLHEKIVPRLVARECHNLIQNLGEITRGRHHKYGNTVFHLEPNVKDGPGGLRDYNVAYWLALISAMEKLASMARPGKRCCRFLPAARLKRRSTSRCRRAAFCTSATGATTTR